MSAYIAIYPMWTTESSNQLLLAICQALPKVPEQCYISIYPGEIIRKNLLKAKGPPYFRFANFIYPVVGKSKPNTSAAEVLLNDASTNAARYYTCYAESNAYGWPAELFDWVDKPEALLEEYSSPLRGQATGTILTTLVIPSTRLEVLHEAMCIKGGK
jgi:hypothetical protein